MNNRQVSHNLVPDIEQMLVANVWNPLAVFGVGILEGERRMDRSFVPADTTIAELEKQAADIEDQARKEPEPLATELRGNAKLLRAWILDLRSNRWTAFRP